MEGEVEGVGSDEGGGGCWERVVLVGGGLGGVTGVAPMVVMADGVPGGFIRLCLSFWLHLGRQDWCIPANTKTFLRSSQLESVLERLLRQKYTSSVVFLHLRTPFSPSKKSTPSVMQNCGQFVLRHVPSVQAPRTNWGTPGLATSSPVAWQRPLLRQT